MGAGDPRGERRVSAALGRIGLGLLLLAAAPAGARAHVGGSTGYASITVSRSTVRYTLTLPTAALPSDLAEALRLAQAGSQQNRDKLLDVLRRHIILRANGTRCEPGPGQVVPSAFDATSFTMQLDFACGSAVRDLLVEDNIFDVLGSDHHTLAKVETDGETRELAALRRLHCLLDGCRDQTRFADAQPSSFGRSPPNLASRTSSPRPPESEPMRRRSAQLRAVCSLASPHLRQDTVQRNRLRNARIAQSGRTALSRFPHRLRTSRRRRTRSR